MIHQQKLKNSFSNLVDFIRHGCDYHPLGHRGGAGRNQATLHLFNFNQTNATGTIGKQLLRVTKHRNIDASFLGSLINSGCLADCYLFSVNRKINHLNLVSKLKDSE